MLYIHPVYISVLPLNEDGKRLSDYKIKIARPIAGWLVYERIERAMRVTWRARLVDDTGRDLLPWLEGAALAAARPRHGMLLVGTTYRRKGTKHSIGDRQEWWCEAPPRLAPIIDHSARVREAEAAYVARCRADGQ